MMGGIIGYVGKEQVVPILIDGLEQLEYRGYDSVGIGFIKGNELEVIKCEGRISCLIGPLSNVKIDACIGIGHTRWATHGLPSEVNAHPHRNPGGNIAVVHNGIIENHIKLKAWLMEEGQVEFLSETDSEVIVHLIDYYYEGNLLKAMQKATSKLKGTYAIAALSIDDPDQIVVTKKDNPMIIGVGQSGNFISSDIPPLLKHTREVYHLENGEFATVGLDFIDIVDATGKTVNRELVKVPWDPEEAEQEGYPYFTLKEIYEQPKVIENIYKYRYSEYDEAIEGITFSADDLKGIEKIAITGCGSSFHSGVIGKYLIETLADIPVEVAVASEFRYSVPHIDKRTLVIVISQSGETLDSLISLRAAKANGARVLSVVNVLGSSIAKEADDVMNIYCGPEIGVASTKAYTAELASLYILAIHLGILNHRITHREAVALMDEMQSIPEKIQSLLDRKEILKHLAQKEYSNEHMFFIGRGHDLPTAFEGSLKLKEITYINSFALPAGELKHGTLALVENGTLVFAIATQDNLYHKILSDIRAVKAKGAHVIAIALEDDMEIKEVADYVITIPYTISLLTPILSVIPLQLLAYYVGVDRGNDVDKPRNLAKIVSEE